MAAPQPQSVVPSAGAPTGDELTRVEGLGIGERPLVTFGGVAAEFVGLEPSAVLLLTPRHALGVVDVAITNLDAAGRPVCSLDEVAHLAHVERREKVDDAHVHRLSAHENVVRFDSTVNQPGYLGGPRGAGLVRGDE